MILNNLKLSNYKQYASLSLEFREGLVGIIGKNGAGKSTIFEAILYCLFGRDESNKNLVRSSFADPKANVLLELDFTIGESCYRVRREFRGKAMAVGAELFKNDLMVAKGVSAVNDELVAVLHMERDAFKRSVFSGQKELSELSDTSGEARKRMVRKMLGLDTLDEVQVKVNADIRDLNSRIAGQSQNLLAEADALALETEIAAWNEMLTANQSELEKEGEKLRSVEAQYKVEQQKFEAEEKRLGLYNSLNRELSQLQERLSGLRLQRDTLDQKNRSLLLQKEKLDATRSEFALYESGRRELEALEAEQQRQLNQAAYQRQIADLAEPLRETGARIADLTKALSQKPEIEQALREKQVLVAQLKQEREAKRSAYQEITNRISDLEGRIRERREKVAHLQTIGKAGTCPTCFQPVRDAYDAVLAQLGQEIDALHQTELKTLENDKKTVYDAGVELKARQEQAELAVTELMQQHTRLVEAGRQQSAEETTLQRLQAQQTKYEIILREIGEVRFDEAVYSALKSKITALEPRYLEFSKEENYVARELPSTQLALGNTGTAIAEAEKNIGEKTGALAQSGYDEQAYTQAKSALTGFAETLNAQSGTVRALEKTSLELRNNIERHREKLRANERIKSQISDKLEETDLLRKLAEMLGLFKTEILEKISPGISREASELFSRITRGKYESIRVDENFDFAIADGGVYYPIERFSGGEIDLANFCLRIAVTKAIMDLSGAGQGIGFLAFDEIFGSQDEERRLEMMLALNYLQEQFRQIYIVSHIDSLKDFFPHILEVQSGEAGSSVVWKG